MRAAAAILALSLSLCLPAAAEDAAPAGETGVNYDRLQQIALTEAQIKGYVEAMPDMQAAIGDAPADASEPDAKTMAKLDDIARKHGFRNFDDYNTVAGNISLVLDGVDPQSKTYVGPDKLIENAIAGVKADKQMTEPERQAALADLDSQRTASPAVKFPGNIELVVRNYDALTGPEAGK